MTYIYMFLVIAFEVIATSSLKWTQGFTAWKPSIIVILLYLLSHYLFSKVVLKIDLSIAYALWCGVGILVTTLVSKYIYKETLSTMSLIGALFVMVGCILVNLGAKT